MWKSHLLLLGVILIVVGVVKCGNDRVRLDDVKTLTLHQGKYTNGQRASPVPQLKCIGGTAGCSSFTPQVVQCHNKGSDGYDTQWECKTDMDNAYRFGRVEVSCEGYDYPEDPYVLRGSCGLEYTLDFTREGHDRQSQGHHNYYGDQHHDENRYNERHNSQSIVPSWMSNVVVLGVILIFMYMIYVFCLRGSAGGPTAPPYDTPGADPPPPYGSNYAPPRGGGDPGCSSQYSQYGSQTSSGGATGNFWTGAATGGLLGYLFGSRNSYGPTYTRRRPWGSSWGSGTQSYRTSGWGGGTSGFGSSGGASSTSSRSTGTRTASGFGGTKRR